MSDLLEQELVMKRRALGQVRLKLAKLGISADPYVIIEEEDLAREVRAIERELGRDQTPTIQERRSTPIPPRYQPEPDPVFQQRMVGQQAKARQADIEHQMTLLRTHRANLAHYRAQSKAFGGIDLAPPITRHGVNEGRMGIAAAKAALNRLGQQVDDLPGDE